MSADPISDAILPIAPLCQGRFLTLSPFGGRKWRLEITAYPEATAHERMAWTAKLRRSERKITEIERLIPAKIADALRIRIVLDIGDWRLGLIVPTMKINGVTTERLSVRLAVPEIQFKEAARRISAIAPQLDVEILRRREKQAVRPRSVFATVLRSDGTEKILKSVERTPEKLIERSLVERTASAIALFSPPDAHFDVIEAYHLGHCESDESIGLPNAPVAIARRIAEFRELILR
jgi:hypothetical protein